jgi:hypothetical protein
MLGLFGFGNPVVGNLAGFCMMMASAAFLGIRSHSMRIAPGPGGEEDSFVEVIENGVDSD